MTVMKAKRKNSMALFFEVVVNIDLLFIILQNAEAIITTKNVSPKKLPDLIN